jgi:hypothetical protein
VYPPHALSPEDVLTFVELHGFVDDWADLGLNDTDLQALQGALMAAPTCGRVIQGTGGLRKLRFAPARWKKGKSGAIRVCYVYFPAYAVILLVVPYAKNEKDTLTNADKKTYRRLTQAIEAEFAKRFRK